MESFLRLFGYYLETTYILKLQVEGTDRVLENIHGNEITVLGENDEEASDAYTLAHIQVGVEIHYIPEDDVHGKALKCRILKVSIHRRVKSIQSKKRVVKPKYELTVRPVKVNPKSRSPIK